MVDGQDDLLAELDELEQQDLEEKLIDVGPAVDLPSVPSALPTEPSRGTCATVSYTHLTLPTIYSV